jgi:hypothetical protein
LIEQATGAKRAVMDNGTNPGFDGLPEADKADMHYFFGQIGLVLPVLGIHVLQPEPTASTVSVPGSANPQAAVVFEMSVGTARASASEAEGKIVVHKGSTARKTGTPGWDAYRKLRDQLVADGKLADGQDPALLVFTEDVAFDSPSAAATVVYASNVNGPMTWKVKGSSLTYKAWQQQQTPVLP